MPKFPTNTYSPACVCVSLKAKPAPSSPLPPLLTDNGDRSSNFARSVVVGNRRVICRRRLQSRPASDGHADRSTGSRRALQTADDRVLAGRRVDDGTRRRNERLSTGSTLATATADGRTRRRSPTVRLGMR